MSSTVLVTGGASGVGRAISELFLQHDWEVCVHYHRSDDGARALAERDHVHRFQADLSEVDGCRELAKDVRRTTGELELVVNNAALFLRTPLEDATEEDWERQMALNARTPFFLVRELVGSLRSTEGAVVNLLDWAVRSPYPAYLPYFASKGALQTLTTGLARALGPDVRVNGVAPGPIDFPDDYPDEQRRSIIQDTVLKRQGRREEVAEAVYFLGVRATYTTGTVVEVDGGRHL